MADMTAAVIKDGISKEIADGDALGADYFNAALGFQKAGSALAVSDIVQDGTSTSATSFQIDSGNTGPRFKNSSGDVRVRNAADSAYASIDMASVKISGSLALDASALKFGGVTALDTTALKFSGVTAVDANGAAKVASAVAGDGLTHTSGVLSVHVDGSTLETSSSTLRVKDSGVTAAKLADAVADVMLTQSVSHDSEGTVGADTFAVTVQLKDAQGNNLAARGMVEWWLSDASGSTTLTSQTPSITFNDGASLQQVTANKHYRAITDATGKLTVHVTITGDVTVYLNSLVNGVVTTTTLDFN